MEQNIMTPAGASHGGENGAAINLVPNPRWGVTRCLEQTTTARETPQNRPKQAEFLPTTLFIYIGGKNPPETRTLARSQDVEYELTDGFMCVLNQARISLGAGRAGYLNPAAE